jgi:hypothetical protein
VVQVGAVGGVEPEGRELVGEELGVDPVGAPAAVLVGLDLDERRLGRPESRGIAKQWGSASLSR